MLKTWLESSGSMTAPSKKATNQGGSHPLQTANALVPGFLFVFGKGSDSVFKKLIDQKCFDWQKKQILQSSSPLHHFTGSDGVYWVITPSSQAKNQSQKGYGFFRDLGGSIVSHLKSHPVSLLNIQIQGLKSEEELGFLVGLELGSYQFKKTRDGKHGADLPPVRFVSRVNQLQAALSRAKSVNIARHFVNLPPNDLNPGTFESYLEELQFSSSMKIDVWDEKKLKAEKMNLHLAVGSGAEHKSKFIHLRYRPKKRSAKAPIAFVGKGITFDTGGLDIKPSSAMRLMKKDMGGAAAVVALAKWVDDAKISRACDFYLALAENAVDANSFRPSDVITSRAGYKVEIDNTDAEGRLVLADALDVAVTQKNKEEPEFVIDVATLTGAIKVALGADLAGLFSNDDALAKRLSAAATESDDPVWRMPLVQKYFTSLSSPFADFKNSAEGFGGAITAALFLERFVKGKKWAHFDIYAWTDKPQGALQSVGGSGQIVQALIQFLENEG